MPKSRLNRAAIRNIVWELLDQTLVNIKEDGIPMSYDALAKLALETAAEWRVAHQDKELAAEKKALADAKSEWDKNSKGDIYYHPREASEIPTKAMLSPTAKVGEFSAPTWIQYQRKKRKAK